MNLFLIKSFSFLFIIFLLSSYPQTSKVNTAFQKDVFGRKILVALKEEPPFIMKDTDGFYYGLSVDLWRYLADELKIDYEFKEYTYALDIIRDLKYGQIDICINPLHVSGTRIRQMDVAQPFFISSLGIATNRNREKNTIETFLSNIFSWAFFKLITTLISIVVLFGIIVWFIEKKNNNKDFRNGINGILDGVWWSTVTITTVGYGDKTPKTGLGRIISMVWMFAAISLISSFTATITSRLTINNLETNIKYLDDLKKMGRIGTVSHSESENYLLNHKIKIGISFEKSLEGLLALSENEIDIFIFDKSVMQYMIEEYELGKKIKISPVTFNRQYFSFVMPKNSRLFREINPEIVDRINKDSWQQVLKKYNLSDK